MINENDIKFNMFGVPKGFDHYGSREDNDKLQMYYDNSDENIKMHVSRKSNGEIIYAYLRYGMISGVGRTGSFFGMSVTFKNKYCDDVNTLYELFNRAYAGIIKEGKILEVLQNGKVKYKINSFKEVQNSVKHAERYIKNNLIEAFQEDMYPLDNSFLNDNLNKVARLNSGKDNNLVINALKKYGGVIFLPENKEINKVELQKKDSFSVAGNNIKVKPEPKSINSLISDFDIIMKTAEFDSDGKTKIIISKDELDIILKSLRSNQIKTNIINNGLEK